MKVNCRKWRRRVAALAILCGFVVNSVSAAGIAVRLDLDGALGVATAEYIIDGIKTAEAEDAALVIIRMDTPGGLVEPMRDIVQAILGSSVPVVTYVSPGGARADSAGTYILLASHVAAMAPTTHLGAATPVSMFGGGDSEDKSPIDIERPGLGDESTSEEDDESEKSAPASGSEPGSAMERKVMNDAIAYIRSLAEAHGRNADWAEDAVVNAATLTATQALDQNVIDLIAVDEDELLQSLNGLEVTVNNETVTINTDGVSIKTLEPSWRLKVLNTIASPEITVLLLMIGVYGLLFEGYNPGAIVPGVAGVICLLLAAYALQVLPVNYAGLALIVVGLVLIVAEAFVPSFGALGIGGVAAIIFGSIMMFDSGVPGFGISMTFVIGMALVSGLFLFWLVSYLVRLRKRGAVFGAESIVGGSGEAMLSFTGEGKVWLEGESWAAISKVPIEKGQEVVVVRLDGLVLQVKPAQTPTAAGSGLQTQE